METLYEQIAYASNYANNEFFLFQEGSGFGHHLKKTRWLKKGRPTKLAAQLLLDPL